MIYHMHVDTTFDTWVSITTPVYHNVPARLQWPELHHHHDKFNTMAPCHQSVDGVSRVRDRCRQVSQDTAGNVLIIIMYWQVMACFNHLATIQKQHCRTNSAGLKLKHQNQTRLSHQDGTIIRVIEVPKFWWKTASLLAAQDCSFRSFVCNKYQIIRCDSVCSSASLI